MQQHIIRNKIEHNHPEEIKQICTGIKHLAFIPDGNRRWAQQHEFYTTNHRYAQFEKLVPSLISCMWHYTINHITFWLLSTNNMDQRSGDDKDAIIKSCYQVLLNIEPLLHDQKAKLVHLGRKDRIPYFLQKKIIALEHITKDNRQRTLALAIDYSGQEEMLHAIKEVVTRNSSTQAITEQTLLDALHTHKFAHPLPDLIIRTGGAQRLSDFMNLQSGYSELYFSEKLFPDFSCHDLNEALYHFGEQKRRFGKN